MFLGYRDFLDLGKKIKSAGKSKYGIKCLKSKIHPQKYKTLVA